MSSRPSVDDLKEARDGQLSAGKPPPVCYICEKEIGVSDDLVRLHMDGVDEEGRRFGRMEYAHDGCYFDE